MDPFKFEHSLRFTEERYVELFGVFLKKTRPLRIAAVGAAGVACLFSPYTLLVGILLLGAAVFGTFVPRWIPQGAAHTYRNSPYLHDRLTYGIDDRGLWLAGPLIEARVPWKAARIWDARDGWLRISAPGAPWFWFPVAALKRAGVYERVMERCKQHAVRFNSGEAVAKRAQGNPITIGRGGRLRPWGAVTVRFDLKIRTQPPGAVTTENCGWVEVAGVLRAETVALARFDQRPTPPRGEEELAEGGGSVKEWEELSTLSPELAR